MSLPPKTDDEISAPDDGSKPAKRGRPRARKAGGEAETARDEGGPAIFVPEARPEPEAPSQSQHEPQESRQQDSGGSRDVASEQSGGGDGRQGQGGGGQGHGGGRGEWQD